MSRRFIWCSACIAAVMFCAVPEQAQGQGCSTEKTENATVDLKVALSRGVRGADPVHVASWEACVHVCCVGKSITANKKCNLVVFKTQWRRNSPNCYLFHCPTEEACQLKPAAGLVTYGAIKEVLKPASPLNKALGLTANGSAASPKPVVFGTSGPTTLPVRLSPSPKPVAKTVTKTTMKSTDKTREPPHLPGGGGANSSPRWDSLPTHPTISSVAPINMPPSLSHTDVKVPAVTPSALTDSPAPVPPSKATSTARATADNGTMFMATVSPRGSSPAARPALTSQGRGGDLGPQPSSPSKTVLPAALQEAPLSHGQLSGPSDSLDGPPSEKPGPYLGDKSVLLAALLFGVVFLLLAHGVIGRKMLESLRHRRYSRLDYLINGMYANV